MKSVESSSHNERRNKKQPKSMLPNLLTLTRLGMSIAAESVIYPHLLETQQDFILDSIIFSMLLASSFALDAVDGKLAKKLDSRTLVGHYLDWGTDAVNFTVLGSTIVYLLILG